VDVLDLNYQGVLLAKNAVRDVNPEAFVAASIGPLQASDQPYASAYAEQIMALVSAFPDLIKIETQTNLACIRVAVETAKAAMHMVGVDIPIQLSVAKEQFGSATLLWTLVKEIDVQIVGLNCYPAETSDAECASMQVFKDRPYVLEPNAGLRPSVSMRPPQFAHILAGVVSKYGVAGVGGCCGTNPSHISMLRRQVFKVGVA
jgi:5-methyltetrahydrofolate--homocysteine methyltransferase